jgi:hypothetical protein
MLDPEDVARHLEGRRIVSAHWRDLRRSLEGGSRPSVRKLGILELNLDNGQQFRVAVVNYRSVTMELIFLDPE